MGIKEKFAEFENANFFSRVDSSHILDLFIGLDEKGRKAIELRSAFKPRKVKGSEAIEVNQYSKKEYNTIRFSLTDEEISGLFYLFCDDLIDETKDLKDESDGYQHIISRFSQWKKMFSPSKKLLLTEPEIMGLIGEILFLRGVLARRVGLSEALKSWSGQELTHKDFSYGDTWSEIKAISRGKTTVKISSLEQLDSENDGELVIYSLEKMSTVYRGYSLNKLVLETRNMFMLDEEKDDFLAKVALQGYEYNNYYDDFVYELSSIMQYNVTEDFPKIIAKTLPKAITKASYEIAISEIEDYRIRE